MSTAAGAQNSDLRATGDSIEPGDLPGSLGDLPGSTSEPSYASAECVPFADAPGSADQQGVKSVSSLEQEIERLRAANESLKKELSIARQAPVYCSPRKDSKGSQGNSREGGPPKRLERCESRLSQQTVETIIDIVEDESNDEIPKMDRVDTLDAATLKKSLTDDVATNSQQNGIDKYLAKDFFETPTATYAAQKRRSTFSQFSTALSGSALNYNVGVQVCIYTLAIGGVIFVLVAKATDLGAEDAGHGSSSGSSASCGGGSSGSHRRLGGATPRLLEVIAYCLTSAGMVTFFINILKQPLILGYLLGGVLIGPHAMEIVKSHEEIQSFSSLGLVFLLFMVGLELDVKQLLQMGKVVLVTGLLQFPVCVGIHILLFIGFGAAGIDFGTGDKSVLYCALTCGISSTMIVAKLLSENADMGSPSGRLTVGILIFQDIWAIIVLAIQPDLGNPKIDKLLKTFAMIMLLLVVALSYAKFVMPVVFLASSKNVELMLVIVLCWCFFMSSFAILPFIGLSMELAALISGVALATYPYSAEFNGKIKYIRDFFITIFFCGLGMQIPPPEAEPILTAFLIAVIVLVVRWVGIFCLVYSLGGGTRLAAVATINLSEVSEFALVICSLGKTYGHIDNDTLTIMIWVFALTAVLAGNLLPYNYKIYAAMVGLCQRCRKAGADGMEHELAEHSDEDRSIAILGFHKVAAVLIQTLKHENPAILKRIHVVDFNEKTLTALKTKGVTTAYGDISCQDVLEHAVHHPPQLVLATVPDVLLRGTTNMKLLKLSHTIWPEAHVIVTADNPVDTEKLYGMGADYVIRMSNLCGDKLAFLLNEFTAKAHSDVSTDIFKRHANQEMGQRTTHVRKSVVNFR